MILAAGLGTRLRPLTDRMPKALVAVGGTPLLDLNIRRLMDFGYSHFVVNVHHFASQILEHVARQDYAPLVRFSDESRQLLETGGGLKQAAPLFDDESPILIHNVDILDNVDYEAFAREHHADEDAVLLVSRRQSKRYLLFDAGMRLMGWTRVDTGEVKSPYPWLREAKISVDEHLQVTSLTSHLSTLTSPHSPLCLRFQRHPLVLAPLVSADGPLPRAFQHHRLLPLGVSSLAHRRTREG